MIIGSLVALAGIALISAATKTDAKSTVQVFLGIVALTCGVFWVSVP